MSDINPLGGFVSPAFAARFNSVIDQVALQSIARNSTTFRYGTVASIDTPSRTVQVEFPENAPLTVTVSYHSLRPSEVGQRVRVGTLDGDYYIAEVLGHTIYTQLAASSLIAVDLNDVLAGINSLIPTWSVALGYPEYRIQIAEDAAFATGVIEAVTNNREAEVIPNLDPLKQYWVRLAAGNGDGDFGPYGNAVGPRVPLAGITSDGLPPASSPQPIVTGGIRTITARWLADDTNPDLVTYKVYASTENGFIPSNDTLIGETASTFISITQLANGDSIPTGENIFVRLIARDFDGEAPFGAQGIGQAFLVELGDVGNVPFSAISDGVAPTFSPTPSITPGPGFLYLSWEHPENDDQLVYEVHVSTLNDFNPTANTLIGETTSNYSFIRQQSAADGGGPLNYQSTYYVKLVATDNDGKAPSGAQSSESPNQITADDIVPQSITSALIADASIDNAKIANGSITNAKIGAAAISSLNVQVGAIFNAHIADAQITSAKIDVASINTAHIVDAAITSAKIGSLSAAKITSGTISSESLTLSGSNSTIQSSNWVNGTQGWIIRGDGSAQFNDVQLFDSIDIGGTDTTSFHVDIFGRMFVGSGNYTDAPFRVNNNGNTIVNNLTVTGTHNISSASTTYTGSSTVTYAGATTVESSNFVSSGNNSQGWQLLSNGGANFNGPVMIDGNLTIDSGGIIRTNPDGSGVNLIPDPTGIGFPGIRFGNAFANADTYIAGDDNVLHIRAGDSSPTSFANIELGLGTDMRFRTGFQAFNFFNGFISVRDTDGVRVGALNDDTSFQRGNITARNGFRIFSDAGNFLMADFREDGNTSFKMLSTTNTDNNVTAGAVAANGLRIIRVATSSEKVKTDIEHVGGGTAMDYVRSVDPIAYRSTIPGDTHQPQLGFSAENVASVDARLASWADAEKMEGDPTGIDNTALLSVLYAAVKEQDERLNMIEGGDVPKRRNSVVTAGTVKS